MMLEKDPTGDRAALVFSKLRKQIQIQLGNAFLEFSRKSYWWKDDLTNACQNDFRWVILVNYYKQFNLSKASEGTQMAAQLYSIL